MQGDEQFRRQVHETMRQHGRPRSGGRQVRAADRGIAVSGTGNNVTIYRLAATPDAAEPPCMQAAQPAARRRLRRHFWGLTTAYTLALVAAYMAWMVHPAWTWAAVTAIPFDQLAVLRLLGFAAGGMAAAAVTVHGLHD